MAATRWEGYAAGGLQDSSVNMPQAEHALNMAALKAAYDRERYVHVVEKTGIIRELSRLMEIAYGINRRSAENIEVARQLSSAQCPLQSRIASDMRSDVHELIRTADLTDEDRRFFAVLEDCLARSHGVAMQGAGHSPTEWSSTIGSTGTPTGDIGTTAMAAVNADQVEPQGVSAALELFAQAHRAPADTSVVTSFFVSSGGAATSTEPGYGLLGVDSSASSSAQNTSQAAGILEAGTLGSAVDLTYLSALAADEAEDAMHTGLSRAQRRRVRKHQTKAMAEQVRSGANSLASSLTDLADVHATGLPERLRVLQAEEENEAAENQRLRDNIVDLFGQWWSILESIDLQLGENEKLARKLNHLLWCPSCCADVFVEVCQLIGTVDLRDEDVQFFTLLQTCLARLFVARAYEESAVIALLNFLQSVSHSDRSVQPAAACEAVVIDGFVTRMEQGDMCLVLEALELTAPISSRRRVYSKASSATKHEMSSGSELSRWSAGGGFSRQSTERIEQAGHLEVLSQEETDALDATSRTEQRQGRRLSIASSSSSQQPEVSRLSVHHEESAAQMTTGAPQLGRRNEQTLETPASSVSGSTRASRRKERHRQAAIAAASPVAQAAPVGLQVHVQVVRTDPPVAAATADSAAASPASADVPLYQTSGTRGQHELAPSRSHQIPAER
jgi:hypothetical protein